MPAPVLPSPRSLTHGQHCCSSGTSQRKRAYACMYWLRVGVWAALQQVGCQVPSWLMTLTFMPSLAKSAAALRPSGEGTVEGITLLCKQADCCIGAVG